MKRLIHRFSWTVSIMAVSAIVMAAGDAVLLRLQLTSGTTESYKVETKVKQTVTLPNGMGDQEVNLATTSAITVKTGTVSADGAGADVEVVTNLEKVDVDGPAAQMMQMKPGAITQKGKIDSQGRYLLESPKQASAFAAMATSPGSSLATFLVELPTKAVSVGDSWDIAIPKSVETGNIDQKILAKLEGEETFEGQSVWVVRLTGAMKADVDTSKLPKEKDAPANPLGDMKMLMKSTTVLDGKGLISKASGKTLKLSAKMKLKVNFELPDMGATFESNGNAEYTVTAEKG